MLSTHATVKYTLCLCPQALYMASQEIRPEGRRERKRA